MKDETRGAIVIVVGVALYLSALYCRRATEPQIGDFLDRALGSEGGEILRADAVAVVPETVGRDIEIWHKGAGRVQDRLPNRESLAGWLCSTHAPQDIAVVMLHGIPDGRGRLESAAAEGRITITHLPYVPFRIECQARVKFYSFDFR